MQTYIAMVRGINVSGHKIVRMEQLRKSCARIGFEDVQTYVQSGNIMFSSAMKSTDGVAKKIGEAILRDCGFDIHVLVKTQDEMKGVIKRNPFVKQKGIDLSRLYVTFLSEAAPKNLLPNLQKLRCGLDEFSVGRDVVYLHCPISYGNTKLSNTAIEKALSVSATTRNWKTVNTLSEMADLSATRSM